MWGLSGEVGMWVEGLGLVCEVGRRCCGCRCVGGGIQHKYPDNGNELERW